MSAPDLAAQRAVLDRVAALEREQAVLYAAQARARAEMVRVWGQDQGVYLELAGTARIGQTRAGNQLARAERLVAHLPVALGLLERGVMRVGTVELLLDLTRTCAPEVQQVLDARLSEQLCALDAVDARRLLAGSVPQVEAELDPAAQQQRHAQARADRGVWVQPGEDGMARVGAALDQVSARRWALDLEELVRAQKVLDDRDGVRRSQAQRRADVFAELPSRVLALADAAARDRLTALLAQAQVTAAEAPADARADARPDRDALLVQLLRLPVRNPLVLNVHIPMTTLLDLDQRSGWLEGVGPLPALHARMLQPVAGLRRVAVDPRTGVPLGIDPLTGTSPPWPGETDPPPGTRPRHRRDRPPTPPPADPAPEEAARHQRQRLLALLGPPMYLDHRAEPQHDPSAPLRRLTQLRDQSCDGPGCPRTATACELDHEHDHHAGGPTAPWNLRHRSTRCHHAKHAGWTAAHDPGTAVTAWTSPAGSTYHRHSPWQPPTEVPDDLELPAPHPQPSITPDADARDDDHPLWPAQQDRRAPRRRVLDPDHETGTPPPPDSSAPRTWDDGPPPF